MGLKNNLINITRDEIVKARDSTEFPQFTDNNEGNQIKKFDTVEDTKFTKIYIDKYISKDLSAVQAILESVIANEKILINGPMGIGKTYFISTDLLKYAKSIGKKVVMVIPGVAQLENLNINKGLPIVYSGRSYYEDDIVAVTPDSLLTKVVEKMRPNSYILIIDESHQKILDANFRIAFRNIDIAEKSAYRIIYMTATPRALILEKFDNIIEIITDSSIRNIIKVECIDNKTKSNLADIMNSIIIENLENYNNIIFFQNDKKLNKIMANLLEKGRNVTEKVYKDKYQYSIFMVRENKSDHTVKTRWEWLIKTQNIQAGEENKQAKEGMLTADISIVTSVITAGIDLRVPEGHKALLIIDATQRIVIDNVIQLIGRFREGIDVLILVKPHIREEDEYVYKSFESMVKSKLDTCTKLAQIFNEDKVEIENYLKIIKVNCIKFTEEKSFIVDRTLVAEKAYGDWNKLLLYNTTQFINLLKIQKAFEVVGEIELLSWSEQNSLREVEKIKADSKKKFNKAKKEILLFDDEALLAAITKKYDELDESQVVVAKIYNDLVSPSSKENLRITERMLTGKDETAIDKVKCFRYFNNNTWVAIKIEIDEVNSRLINLDFKLNKNKTIATYLDKKLYKIRTQVTHQQAKIRSELYVIEKKQGRITDKILTIVTNKMIKEGYLLNKSSKIYLDKETEESDREDIFKVLKATVMKIVERTYNITVDGRISSVKY